MLPEKSTEFQLIDRIHRQARAGEGVRIGIGDDAAVVDWPAANEIVVAADMLMEGVHFEFPAATPRDVGHKALAVNLSDLAAMAAIPRFALVSIALPTGGSSTLADDVMQGLIDLADDFEVALIGGDTNSWNGPLIINVTVIGQAHSKGPVTRAGAEAGDVIFVTGPLGGSLAGHHLSFQPRVREALQLQELVSLHAMIDISDGLVADLYHLLEESQVGARLDAASIPIRDVVREDASSDEPLSRALADGEDFELLFTVSPEDAGRIEARTDVVAFRIGTVISEMRCELAADGVTRELPRLGWSHAMPGGRSDDAD